MQSASAVSQPNNQFLFHKKNSSGFSSWPAMAAMHTHLGAQQTHPSVLPAA